MTFRVSVRAVAILIAGAVIGATGGPIFAAPSRAPLTGYVGAAGPLPPTTICAEEPAPQYFTEASFLVSNPCDEDTPPPVINNSETDRITNRLSEINELCQSIPLGYRIACIEDQYRLLAQSMSDGDQSREIKRALVTAADKLKKIAEDNADNTAQKLRPKVNVGRFGRSASHPLTPVRPEVEAAANQAAIAVLDEVSTLLLRSADSSRSQSLYYTQIADAVDSNKVLLRST